MLKDVAERLAEYKIFYPDTTTTTVSVADAKSISYEKGFELSKKICRMTHSIIRKTKCFRILERNAKISKTKRNFSRLYPTPQKFKKIDRLRRKEIHLKAVRTSS